MDPSNDVKLRKILAIPACPWIEQDPPGIGLEVPGLEVPGLELEFQILKQSSLPIGKKKKHRRRTRSSNRHPTLTAAINLINRSYVY
jgi:hypothetical protein